MLSFIFLLLSFQSSASVNDSDSEQLQLKACFEFSNFFGYSIDTINSFALYENIKTWYGTPYKYAGSNKKGIDCSGFVNEMYRSVFYKQLKRSAIDIYSEVPSIHKADLREGDLVFFKIRKHRISHIGIYLGQNKFVHASTNHGVVISDLSDSYYKQSYAGAGRVE